MFTRHHLQVSMAATAICKVRYRHGEVLREPASQYL
jgi:hypothetical protein